MLTHTHLNPTLTHPQEADTLWESMYTSEAEAAEAAVAANMEANTAALGAANIAVQEEQPAAGTGPTPPLTPALNADSVAYQAGQPADVPLPPTGMGAPVTNP
jgi:hypothetical protein